MYKEIIESLNTRKFQYLNSDQRTMMARVLNIVSKKNYLDRSDRATTAQKVFSFLVLY